MKLVYKPINYLSKFTNNNAQIYTSGPGGPWVAHLRKGSKVTVEPIIENPSRVATQSGNQGKWPKQIPCREKSGNFKILKKSGNYQGILQKVKKRYTMYVSTGSFSS